jgi:hypothetical protein
MAAIDWVVFIVCAAGIVYGILTMPRPMIIKREKWHKHEELSKLSEVSKQKDPPV